MNNPPLVQKASGEKEPFSQEKLENSMKRAGASDDVIASVIEIITPWLHEGVTTKEIYKKAFALLKQGKRSTAARYSLKKAIMELGPTGYPFEQFIGKLLETGGYKTEVGLLVKGHCVQHEVDVLATQNNKQCFIECKYYNSQGKFGNVKVPLYIHSRFKDIVSQRNTLDEFKGYSFEGWCVTNTRFTTDAIDYGNCAGLRMISWDHPRGNSLKDLIEKDKVFPITAITLLNKQQKGIFMEEGIVICRQLIENPELLEKLGVNDSKKKNILNEAKDLCS